MSLIQELDSPPLPCPSPARDGSSLFSAPPSPFTVRDVPVVLRGGDALSPAMQVTLHYQCLHIEGLQELIPDKIEIDISSLADGGELQIDQMPLPACCEVIGVWFTNPLVTVAPIS